VFVFVRLYRTLRVTGRSWWHGLQSLMRTEVSRLACVRREE
jgi:hypothetical protein